MVDKQIVIVEGRMGQGMTMVATTLATEEAELAKRSGKTCVEVAWAVAKEEKKAMTYIPNKLYSKFVELMPILCVDVLIHDGEGSILLVKRKQEPAKGKWWLIGGRVLKGEGLLAAVQRKCWEEVGLNVYNIHALEPFEFFWNTSEQGGSTHTVPIVYTAQVKGELSEAVLDETSEGFKIIGYDVVLVDNSFDPYLKKVVDNTNH